MFLFNISATVAIVIKITSGRIEFVEGKLNFVKQSAGVVVGCVNTILLGDTVVVIGNKKLDTALESCDYKESDCNINALCFARSAKISADAVANGFGNVGCADGYIVIVAIAAFVLDVTFNLNNLCIKRDGVNGFCG